MKFLDETGLKFIATKIKELRDSLTNKVDKVTGKDLSSNDYTNEAKAKVDAIPANPKYTDTVQDLSEYAKKSDIKSKADKTEIKTKLSEMTDDVTHRLVTDTEKATWNNKIDESMVLYDYDSENLIDPKSDEGKKLMSFRFFSDKNDLMLAFLPGFIDKRVKDNLPDMSKYKQQVILTQSEYDKLSSANKNDGSKIYFIKE